MPMAVDLIALLRRLALRVQLGGGNVRDRKLDMKFIVAVVETPDFFYRLLQRLDIILIVYIREERHLEDPQAGSTMFDANKCRRAATPGCGVNGAPEQLLALPQAHFHLGGILSAHES